MASLTFSNPFLHSLPPSPITEAHSRALCVGSAALSSSFTVKEYGSISEHFMCHSNSLLSRFLLRAGTETTSLSEPVLQEQESPPKLVIDQESDPDGTVLELEFRNGLPAFLGAMREIKDLGLTVVRSRIFIEGLSIRASFSLIEVNTGCKIEDPKMLEALNHSIVDNKELAVVKPDQPPKEKPTTDVAMHVKISEAGPRRSLLFIEAANKPGLLREILRRLTDVQISYTFVEYETEGPVARANLFLNHKEAGLNEGLRMVLTSYLRYYLARLLGLKKIDRGPVDPFADN